MTPANRNNNNNTGETSPAPPQATDRFDPVVTADQDINRFDPVVTADDDTVTTRGSSKPSVRFRTESSMTIKLTMQSKTEIASSDVAVHTTHLLSSILSAFPTTVTIYDNHNNRLTNTTNTGLADFQKQFTISKSSANKRNSKPHLAWVIFRIDTKESLRNIRTHPAVESILRTSHGRLAITPWDPSVRDVVSLGFFVGCVPRYQTSSSFEKDILTQITTATKAKQGQIPKFHCVLSNVTASLGKIPARCQSFDLQVERQHVQKFLSLAYKSFSEPDGPRLMFYRLRHHDPMTFAKAVHKQALYQESHRIVAIKGIPDMWSFEPPLCKEFPAIKAVLDTPSTNTANASGLPINRYNLLCSTADFVSLARDLHHRMTSVLATTVDLSKLSPETEPAAVISRFPGRTSTDSVDSSSHTSRASYYSNWTTEMADYHPEETDIPPSIIATDNTEQSTNISSYTSTPTPTNAWNTNIGYGSLPAEEVKTQLKALQETVQKLEVQTLDKELPPPLPDPSIETRFETLTAEVKKLETERPIPLPDPRIDVLTSEVNSLKEMLRTLMTQLQPTEPTHESPSPFRKKTKSNTNQSSVPPHPGTPVAATATNDQDEVMTDDPT
jgi:hypothetical protein